MHFLPVCGDPRRLISALVCLLRGPFDLKIKKKSGFSDIFLLKSPRTVITNLGTHRTELRQVRADFEVFEWSLTVLHGASSQHKTQESRSKLEWKEFQGAVSIATVGPRPTRTLQ